ncbi:acyltransferase [Campylobacter sp. faydin G-105]|nr:acyltransferase [Campylobacter anatolicus]
MHNIKYNNFDFLRLFAAFQVMFGHIMYNIKPNNILCDYLAIFLNNFNGVTIFFLISGFLISYSYDRNSNLIMYYKNRILRIYPALYVNILIGIVLLYCFYPFDFNLDFFSWLFSQLTFLQFYNFNASKIFGAGEINAPLWTISIELFFYISLPIIFWIYKKSRYMLLIFFAISIVFFIYNRFSDHNLFINKLINVSIAPYMFIFLIGFYFYKYINYIYIYIHNHFFIYMFIYLIFKLLDHYMQNIIIHILTNYIIFSFVVFSFAFSFSRINNIFKNNDFTYGIYIYHSFFVNIFVELGCIQNYKYALLIILFSVISGILSWFLIEKPALRLKNNSLYSLRLQQNE